MNVRLVAALLLAGGSSLAPAVSQPARILGFGDSMVAGTGDEEALGWPGRLARRFAERGQETEVLSAGGPGESTVEGLLRFDGALGELTPGDLVVLLMGSNDVRRVSLETTLFNLDEMARRAEAKGISAMHLTVPPRDPTLGPSRDDPALAELAIGLVELAWSTDRLAADVHDDFRTDPVGRYASGDPVHPSGAGYERIAELVELQLVGPDVTPPYVGRRIPIPEEGEITPEARIQVDLYDLASGIDLEATVLLVNGVNVDAELISDPPGRVSVSHALEADLGDLVQISIRSADLAGPPNRLERELGRYLVADRLAGDVDGDARVDGIDLVLLGLAFGSRRGGERYDRAADLDGDADVDGLDLAILAANFGVEQAVGRRSDVSRSRGRSGVDYSISTAVP